MEMLSEGVVAMREGGGWRMVDGGGGVGREIEILMQ